MPPRMAISRKIAAAAPAAPHVGLHQPVDHAAGPIGWHDSVRQAMPNVGGDRPDRSLLTVEPQVVGPFLFPPEALIELFIEADGALAELLRTGLIPPDVEGLGHPEQRIEGVPLEFA